jgi:hypothetical protein
MEALVAAGRFTNKELKEINYCCIYLQAFFMSNITKLKGDTIEEWESHGQRQACHQSTWDWPFRM